MFDLQQDPKNLFSVAMEQSLHDRAVDYLLSFIKRGIYQEQLCFGLWRPSTASHRLTAIVYDLVLPNLGETNLNGNVSFTPEFLERAGFEATDRGSGLVLMHNHFGLGWQGMSPEDVQAEQSRAAFVFATTNLPLVGMTLGTDQAWSARFWPRAGRRVYRRRPCENVRVVGKQLHITNHPHLRPPPSTQHSQVRTTSAWGEENQSILTRTRVGVVGLGSVGRLVAENLARIGIEEVLFVDFDRLAVHNLDRQIGAFAEDADGRRLKVDLAKEGFEQASTAMRCRALALPAAVSEQIGFEAVLNCDVIFCCVDRPWGRHVLNHIAYAHLIPVIEGGILVRLASDGTFRGADWSCRTAGPDRCCLVCAGAYDPGLVDDERRGLLDDPSYFDSLANSNPLKSRQNVLPFSMSLASHQILQFCALMTGLLGLPDLGDQRFHYNLGEMTTNHISCAEDCRFRSMLAMGDKGCDKKALLAAHPAAEILGSLNMRGITNSTTAAGD